MVLEVTPEFAKKGSQMVRMAPLYRVFQSIRFVVNEEDTALKEELLGMFISLSMRGRRIVVLRYHSTEDRAEKLSMRDSTIRHTMEASGK